MKKKREEEVEEEEADERYGNYVRNVMVLYGNYLCMDKY